MNRQRQAIAEAPKMNRMPSLHAFTRRLDRLSTKTLNRVDAVVDRADRAMEDVQIRAKKYSHTVEEYVQHKPLQALGIAMGIGVLLGILLKRRV